MYRSQIDHFLHFFGRSAKNLILLPALAYLVQDYETNKSMYLKNKQ